jgi:hypothetical protein
LSELYANIFSGVYDECETETVNSDVATTSAGKQLRFHLLAITSDSETSTDGNESSGTRYQ